MNKILIIDEDRELCALLKRSVLSENIEADCCSTGREGLKKLKEKEYQLVILDVMMPGMDGFETLEAIRKQSALHPATAGLCLFSGGCDYGCGCYEQYDGGAAPTQRISPFDAASCDTGFQSVI